MVVSSERGVNMLCSDIVTYLEKQSPPEYAMDWDNVGLLVGRESKDVHRILLALDATKEVIRMAIEENVDMLITHHPMIFGSIKRVNDQTVLGRKILDLIQHDISYFAMHTNFDTIGGMAKDAANRMHMKNTEVLEETRDGEGIGIVGFLPDAMSLKGVADYVKDIFGLENVVAYGALSASHEKIAICPGSGKSVIQAAYEKGATCLVTGDIGHHEGIDAVELGVSILDASHYGLEKIFMEYIQVYLKDYCSDVEIIVAETKSPFSVI